MPHLLYVGEDDAVHPLLDELASADGWTVSRAADDEIALRKLEQLAVDAIVVPVRTPGTPAMDLLARVRSRHPAVVRLARMERRADGSTRQRLVMLAHQALAPEQDAASVRAAVERSLSLRSLLADTALRESVGELGQLPTPSTLYQRLTRLLDRPEKSPREVAALVESYPSFAAKVLQTVNSAFFAPGLRCASITHAVSCLGTDGLRSLVLGTEGMGGFAARVRIEGMTQSRFRLRGMLTALLASEWMRDDVSAATAFTAGLLHDVGLVIVASQLPVRAERTLALIRETGEPLHAAEQATFGNTHAHIGAYLLSLWGLPQDVVEAVAHHHTPSAVPAAGLDPLLAVHVAAALTEEVLPWAPRPDGRGDAPLDLARLRQTGMLEAVAGWRASVPEVLDALAQSLSEMAA